MAGNRGPEKANRLPLTVCCRRYTRHGLEAAPRRGIIMPTLSQRKLSLVVGGILLGSLGVMPFASAVPLTTAFELDGDAMAGAAAPGDDWSIFYPTNASSTVFNWSIVHEPTPDTTYFTIGSKDIEDVNEWFSGGASAPDKDEILDG